MHVCLFEQDVDTLEPLALTRAAFDLRCGLVTLGEKLRRTVDATHWSAWVRPALADIVRHTHPNIPVNDASCTSEFWVDARWLPPEGFTPPDRPCVGRIGDEIVWVRLAPGLARLDDVFAVARGLPSDAAGGLLVRYPWDLVDRNPAEIIRDVAETTGLRVAENASLIVVGPPERVFAAATARIDPLVVLDTSNGPIVIEDDVVITSFSRIEGPCVVGRGTQIMGAKIRGGVTLGPQCRIGGEVETSIVHGYTNKYHEGFLGHSYLGEWVNLGAGTHTSDLRNDYGDVAVTIAGQRVSTGRSKVGCYLGDHTKTGLGSLINTGTNIGVFCNVLPAGRFAPKHMPSFTTWWTGELRIGFPMPQLMTTAKKVMDRRGQHLSPTHVRLYEHLWDATDPLRCQVLGETETRLMRRSA